jgi:hypothetical protein
MKTKVNRRLKPQIEKRAVIQPNSTFTNSAGMTFAIEGIASYTLEELRPQLAASWQRRGKPIPQIPTFEVKTVSGDIEKHEHTDQTPKSAEDQIAWDRYVLDKQEFEREYNQLFLRTIATCVVPTAEQFDRWKQRREFIGLDIPEKEFERLELFVNTEVMRSVEDASQLVLSVYRCAGLINEDIVQQAQHMFQDQIQKAFAGVTITNQK